MKIKIAILCLVSFMSFQAQVGVNTNFPKAELHIDGAKDNSASPTPAMQGNDVVVTNIGRLGVGINIPRTKLHINSADFAQAFRLVDGNQGDGKLLTVINGLGDVSWKDRISAKIVDNDGGVGYNGPVNSDMQYIKRKVTLEPGKWMVRTNLLIAALQGGTLNQGFYANFSWAEYNGSSYFLSPDAILGNNIGGSYIFSYGTATGTTIINNTSSLPKTYYLVTRTPTFWGGYNTSTNWWDVGAAWWQETSIIAFPAQ